MFLIVGLFNQFGIGNQLINNYNVIIFEDNNSFRFFI